MDRARLLAPGLWMMSVAPVVVAVRALLAVADAPEPGSYWVFFAVGGSLSGLGMVLAAVATHRTAAFWWVVSGAAVALFGHNVLDRLMPPEATPLGASLVHLGTGIVLWPLRRLGLAAGAVAALGAYLRWDLAPLGDLLLFVGAASVFVLLLLAARDARAAPGAAAAPVPAV